MKSKRPWWRTYGWLVGAVVGLASAAGVGVAVQEFQEERADRDFKARVAEFELVEEVPPPVDAVRQLLEQPGRVVVDPELKGRVGEQQLAAAEAALATAETPARLAYLRAPGAGGEDGYRHSGAAAQWAHAVGQRGHYVVLFDDGRAVVRAVDLEEPYLDARTKGQPGAALVRVAEEMATWEAEERALRARGNYDDWGGVGGGAAFVLMAGVFIILPIFYALRLFISRKGRTA